MEKEEEAYRRGFLHGFGVGIWDKKQMALGRKKPDMEDVKKWRFMEDDKITPPPGTYFETKKSWGLQEDEKQNK